MIEEWEGTSTSAEPLIYAVVVALQLVWQALWFGISAWTAIEVWRLRRRRDRRGPDTHAPWYD